MLLTVEPGKLIQIYKKMLRIRMFEEKVYESFLQAELTCPAIHQYIGQEAVAVGACSAIRDDDFLVTTHRGHGHCIAKGARLDKMMAELYGKVTGYNKGKAGSMHVTPHELGVVYAGAIVGQNIPIAAGVGLSIQLRKTDQVVVCFTGDGASNTGQFHEGMNLAAVWHLPVIFVLENNQYGMYTHISKVCLLKSLALKATAYGMPSVAVDGNDVLQVYESVSEAARRSRDGMGPTLVECNTFLPCGESILDPKDNRDEIELWKKRDPIGTFETKLLETNELTRERISSMRRAIQEEIDLAVKFARESPMPGSDEVLKDIF